jgi:hypothetical protein
VERLVGDNKPETSLKGVRIAGDPLFRHTPFQAIFLRKE